MKNIMQNITRSISKPILKTADTVDTVVEHTKEEMDSAVKPIRKSILKRFPLFFILMVTFGVSAVLFGFERLLMQYDLLIDYPFLILLIGIGVLALTGTIYKKLG